MLHPAYPSTADLSREADATNRNVADLAALRTLHRIVADALLAARQVDEIRHPDRRFTTADAVEALEDMLLNISATDAFVSRGALVVEDC